jgi:hypothetical protein
LYCCIPKLSSPNYFFLDLYRTYPHNRCVGRFENSTSPRFRSIFCKKRACGYTNSRLHPLKKERSTMYTAMLLLCSMTQPNECMQAIDNKGPYLTEKACEQRIVTMMEDTRLLFPYLIQKGYRCEYNSGEST